MKKFLWLFILFFWPCIVFANPLKTKYELSYLAKENLLKGKAIFELTKEGLYEFIKGNITILSMELDSKPLDVSTLKDTKIFKVFNPRKGSILEILFEYKLENNKFFMPQIVEDYLPYPKEAFQWEIIVNKRGIKDLEIFIPYEESEENFQELKTIYRVINPVTQIPPLLRGSFSLQSLTFDKGEILFILPKGFHEKKWKEYEKAIEKEIKTYPMKEILFSFKRLYFYPFFEKKTYPLLTLLPLLRIEDLDKIIESLIEQTLRYGLNIQSSYLLDGLKTYFTFYIRETNQRTFRKNLLLQEDFMSKSFFYLWEKINFLGERKFQEFFKNYFQRYLFNASEAFFMRSFSKEFDSLPFLPFESYEKVSLHVDSEVSYLERENKYYLRIQLTQDNIFRPIYCDLIIDTEKGNRIRRELYMSSKESLVELFLNEKPKGIFLDPEYKLFRNLSIEELPLNWERLFISRGVIYLPKKEILPLYRELLEKLRERGYQIKFERPEITALPADNIISLEEAPLGFHLFVPQEGFYFKILPHPHRLNKFLALIKISSVQEWKKAIAKEKEIQAAKEFFLQKGKLLEVKKDRIVEGIGKDLTGNPLFYGIKREKIISLDDIMPELLPSQVVLIGEKHNEYSHHKFQLEVIKKFYEFFGKDLVIGLEMVQKPFQKFLDEFIAGKLKEEELLKKIEYYDRWGFDYRLYREIFLFAREKKIRLLALDLPQELVKKVSKEGLITLTEEEKKNLPEMDLNQPLYIEFLKRVYQNHNFGNDTNFDYFVQAQILRDEAMADEIAYFLKRNPQSKLIGLVGKGHLYNNYGIPSALKRRGIANLKTIVLGETEEFSPFIGDYWFQPNQADFEKSPTLGVILEETSEGLKIKEVLSQSLAETLALKPGDIILSIDQTPVKGISDLRIILTFKMRGSSISLSIRRAGQNIDLKGIIP